MTYGVKEVGNRFGVGQHTVLAWIRSGELKAIDVSRKRGGKPHWRITLAALEAFEALRTPTPPQPKPRRRKRQANVIEFY